MNSDEKLELLIVKKKFSYLTVIYRPTERISFNVSLTVHFQ